MRLAEIMDPYWCPFRMNKICDKLSKGCWIFKCEDEEEFPKECPLSEFSFLTNTAGLNEAIKCMKKYCKEHLYAGNPCGPGCKLFYICGSSGEVKSVQYWKEIKP